MKRIVDPKRGGEYAGVTGKNLRSLRLRHGLTQAQMALLARTGLTKKRNGVLQANAYNRWENGQSRIPLANYEVLVVKLRLLENGLADFEDLVTEPLVVVLDGCTKWEGKNVSYSTERRVG